MKRTVLLLLTTLTFNSITIAQNFEWAKSMGEVTTGESGNVIAVDDFGNVYIAGEFENTFDFDPNTGVYNLTSVGSIDIFIQKLDANGNFIWAKSIGGAYGDEITSIVVDNLGNIYATGSFYGSVDFDPNVGVYNLTSNSTDIFILKLDATGNMLWAKNIGGGSSDGGKSISVDGLSNVYITGWFQDTVDFDPNVGIYNLISNGAADIFVQKLDANGNFIWAKSMGGIYTEFGNSITVDNSGNVYTTGWFDDTVDFDPNTGTYNLTTGGYNSNVFIQKLDVAGNLLWAKKIGGINPNVLYISGHSFVAVDDLGNVYTMGSFTDTVDFDPNTGIYNLTGIGGDVFIQKLDANGNFIWAKSVGGAENAAGHFITLDEFGYIYTIGSYTGGVDFDPSAGGIASSFSAGDFDIFIQKLDASGNLLWAKGIGSVGYDAGYSIAIDGSNNIYTTGGFNGTVDFDPNTGVANLISAGYTDIFILKLSETPNGTIENAFNDNVQIYPNPNQGLVNIELGELKDVSIKIFNVSGQLIYQKENINTSTYQFELNEAPGMYFVEVRFQDKKEQFKLIKE